MIRLYRVPGLGAEASEQLRKEGGFDPGPIETEYCFYIQSSPLTGSQLGILRKYLATTYLPEGVADETHLGSYPTVLEVGPRQTIETVASSTTVSVFRDCGLTGIERIERSVRMGIPTALTENEANRFLAPLFRKMVFDRMTQERYLHPLETFDSGRTPDPVIWVPIMTGGISEKPADRKDWGSRSTIKTWKHSSLSSTTGSGVIRTMWSCSCSAKSGPSTAITVTGRASAPSTERLRL